MRASMRADGTTCRSTHIPVATVHVGLGGTERSVGGPHTDVVHKCGNHGCDSHQGGYEYHLAFLSGPELLNDIDEQGERWKHVYRPPLPVL